MGVQRNKWISQMTHVEYVKVTTITAFCKGRD